MPIDSNIKDFENLSVEKKTLSTALGFEPHGKNSVAVRPIPVYSVSTHAV